MKILITGARGQLGRDCQAVLAAAHEITATDLPEFDASDAAQIRDHLAAARPEVILNCAAFTRVDDCETLRELPPSLPQPTLGPTASALPKTSPRHTATTTPPTKKAGVRDRTKASPRPTMTSGHSRQASLRAEAESAPW